MAEAVDSIVFVVAGLGAGGAERVIALVASAWVARGRDVTVIAFDRPGDPVYHSFDPGVRLVRLGRVNFAGGAIPSAFRIFDLRRALKRIRPQIAISFLSKINVITLFAGIGMGIPIVVSERNNPQRQSAHRLWALLLDRLYPRAAAIVIQTEASRACLPPSVASAAHVIANPIVPMAVRPTRSDGRTVCAVGRLVDQKGFDLLITAFAQAVSACPGWRLVIWGEGPLRHDLEAQARRLGVGDLVSLPGLSTTPGAWIESADIFALSSRFEGFPNALGEAMAAGLPVVAFDCPFGPSEMICNNRDGSLVSENDVVAFAKALATLMNDIDLQRKFGSSARQRATSLNVGSILTLWDRVLNDVRHKRFGIS